MSQVYQADSSPRCSCTIIPPLPDDASCRRAAKALIDRLGLETVSLTPACSERSLAKIRSLALPEVFPVRQKTIEDLASAFIKYLSDDLEARRPGQKVKRRHNLPRVRHVEELGWQLPLRNNESIPDFVGRLEDLVKTPEIRSHEETLGFLLGSIFHCGPRLPTLSGNCDFLGKSTARIRRERYGRASLVCAVVDGILPSWGRRAYVLFHPLAGSQSWYRPLRDLPEERREIFLSTVISKLEALEIYKDIATSVCTFNPEFEMAKLLGFEDDQVLGLLLPSQAQPQHQGDRESTIDGSDGDISILSDPIDRRSTNIITHRHQTSELSPEIEFINQTKLRHERAYTWPLFTIIYEGDAVKATSLIRAKEASACDVDPYGLGTTYYAVYYCLKNLGLETALHMCQALVELGAAWDDQDEIGNSAVETLIDGLLVTRAMNGRSGHILDWICRAAMLLKVDTNVLWRDLEAYLNSMPRGSLDIDVQDSRGRSALAWAAEYGWTEAASLLIEHGADPRQSRRSRQGDLPLLHLALAGSNKTNGGQSSLGIIKLLVEAGADPNSRDHEGWTPFHVAASWNNYFAVRKLQDVAMIDYCATTRTGENAVDLSGDSMFFQRCLCN
ncbi:hypothetical protein HRR81_000716 [Exophiala dermatitidis]|nr:hypothetical protein HRR81_000716 [Exophiala dermatitidis]KAJ4660576.1 hypothetical protein HRR91_000303 [Exophiala dermatitidis]KAJ9005039.1 hypothetical protein HRR94_000716 [Exophiala dermatitidis]